MKKGRVSRFPAFFYFFSTRNEKSGRFYSSTHITGDYAAETGWDAGHDGDGFAELVVYRPSEGNWYSLNIVTNEFAGIHFGLPADIPVTGDYDSGGRADRAVYRPSDGTGYNTPLYNANTLSIASKTLSGLTLKMHFGVP